MVRTLSRCSAVPVQRFRPLFGVHCTRSHLRQPAMILPKRRRQPRRQSHQKSLRVTDSRRLSKEVRASSDQMPESTATGSRAQSAGFPSNGCRSITTVSRLHPTSANGCAQQHDDTRMVVHHCSPARRLIHPSVFQERSALLSKAHGVSLRRVAPNGCGGDRQTPLGCPLWDAASQVHIPTPSRRCTATAGGHEMPLFRQNVVDCSGRASGVTTLKPAMCAEKRTR